MIYHLVRSRRRTLSVEVQATGLVVVRTPLRTSVAEIEGFLRPRLPWIRTKQLQAAASRSVIPQRTHDRQFYHRGALLEWEVADRRGTAVRRHNDTILLPSNLAASPEVAARTVARWQRREAETLFLHLIHKHLPAIGLPGLRFTELRLRKMSRRWGSCSSTGAITLNEYLIRTPDACIETVVVHEICHLVHLHHGKAFHDLHRDLMPWYQEADELLDAWTVVLYEGTETTNGARGPVPSIQHHERRQLDVGQAEALATSLSNADVSAEAIISGVRPSI